MKAETIICSMNDIRDHYITGYAEKTRAAKVRQSRRFRALCIYVACFALFIIAVPFHPSQMDDPKSGARYELGSYAELCSVLPERNILANIPDSEEASIRAFAECPEGTTDFTDYNNYSYLNIDISYGVKGLNIWCVVQSEETAKEEIDSKPLAYPPEKVYMTAISDCIIYCASHEDQADTINHAVFSIDGSLYKLTTASFSQEELIRYIRDMLDR